MRGGEVEARLPLLELFAGLADDHPLVALATQQRAETLLADAIGRRGIDQVDAQFTRLAQQGARLRVIGDGEAVGVLHPLVAPELDRAQSQRRYAQAGRAQRAMQIVQGGAHGSSVSHTGCPSAGRGSSGNDA